MNYRGEPGPPPPGGWGPRTAIALLAFTVVMIIICVAAERSGQLLP